MSSLSNADTGSAVLTLDRVLRHLGTTVLELLAGEPGRAGPVSGVAIHDAADDTPLPSGAIVLGVGVRDHGGVLDLVRAASAAEAVALVVRSPFEVTDVVRAEVTGSGLVLLGLVPGAAWHQLSTLLGSALGEAAPESLGGVPAGDLFGLANAICALIDAPVTIEDRNQQVLAFSDRQEEADFIRIETILGRRVPDPYATEDELRGAMRTIRRSERPVFLEALELDDERETKARVVVAVRAGDEILGSIWAAVTEPLSPERDQLLLDASRLVALHMLQLRAGADVEQRLIADLVATALEGGPEAAGALARVGLDRSPCVVVALALDGNVTDAQSLARRTTDQERTATAFALHLSVTRPGSVVATLRDTVYAIVPAHRPQDAEINIETTCRAFLQRGGRQLPLLIGIGGIANDPAGLPGSRADADRALRVLRSSSDRAVARSADVEVEAMILELRDLVEASGRGPTGAYAQLLAYDRERNASMIETLRAWLNAHGDVITAAAASHVHQNTFRYRLRRLSEIAEVDLDDPQARFALELQLRIFPPDSPRT